MPKQGTKTKSNDADQETEERKRSRMSTSPSSTRVADSTKRRRKQRRKEERLKRKQEEQQKSIQKIVDLATGKLKEEIEKWKDGTHPDLSKSLRSIREQKVREDRCIICMEGGDDGGSKVDLFSACCGQAYHASCYLQQLTWAQNQSSSSNNNNAKCGVCRQALPKIDASICLPAKSTRSSSNNDSSFAHDWGSETANGGVMGDWRNYSLSSSSSDSDSSSDSSSSSSSSSEDDDSDSSSVDSSSSSESESTTSNRVRIYQNSDAIDVNNTVEVNVDVNNGVVHVHNGGVHVFRSRFLGRQPANDSSSDDSHGGVRVLSNGFRARQQNTNDSSSDDSSTSSSSSSSSSSDSSLDSDDDIRSARSLRYDSLDRLSRTVSSESSLDRWYQRDRVEAMHSSMPSRQRRRRIRSRS